ncbi:maleylpyruvate isomerase family mycothiol-dependent enzyme [Aeromicrobium alkaliterrae]|uniref:Maleylpyruvate isomerase family mycothiol-dependent enzyme n=1 Tax=Aeromicrobium alkaliterrae TaxID=302168 RepID=A0ABN2K6E9_9ACTN
MSAAADGAGWDRHRIARAVGEERLRLADYLDDLSADQWAVRSLCTEWTVRDVAAHLTTTTRATIPFLVREIVRARGSFDRMESTVARERSARFGADEIVEQLRESARSTRRIAGSAPMDPLMDLVIHQQDVARPLGVPLVAPLDRVRVSLAYVAANRFMGGPRRVGGLTLVATDAELVIGTGPEVHGPAIDLLMVAAGRPAAIRGLAGPGLGLLTRRLHG